MAIIKAKEIAKMNEADIKEKLNELKTNLIKSRVTTGKSGKTDAGEIKRTIARLLTFKNKLKQNKKENVKTKPIKEEKTKKQ